MARIQRPGLDYFPLDTDFVRHRAVRKLMKAEGDAAFAVLLMTLSAIYGEQGYYVRADHDFCEDIATELYDSDADDVERILRRCVDYGLFHRETFEAHAVLTSAHIQQQYLFCIRRRKPTPLHPDYCLLSPEEAGEWYPREPRRSTRINVTETPQNVALIPQSKVKESKENLPPLYLPLRETEEQGAEESAEERPGEDVPAGAEAATPAVPPSDAQGELACEPWLPAEPQAEEEASAWRQTGTPPRCAPPSADDPCGYAPPTPRCREPEHPGGISRARTCRNGAKAPRCHVERSEAKSKHLLRHHASPLDCGSVVRQRGFEAATAGFRSSA